MRFFAILISAVFLVFAPARAQLRPVGLQSEVIRAVTAEQGDPEEYWFPFTANALFAATDSGMVMQGRTFDDGKSWVPIGPFNDPPYDIVTMTVQHWGIGPMDGLNLMVAVRPGTVQGAPILLRHGVTLFSGIDSSWERADSGLVGGGAAQTVTALSATYYTGHTPPQPVLAWTENGPWRGAAGGWFWEAVGGVGGEVYAMDVTPKWFGTDVWAAGTTAAGFGDAVVYRSSDAGLTWTPFVFPRALPSVALAVAVAPGFPDTAYASIDGAVRRTTDGGATWDAVFSPPSGRVIALACDPSSPEHIYAGTDDPEFSLHRSTDLGSSWTRIDPLPEQHPAAITCMTVALIDTVPMGRPPRRGLFMGTAGTGVWLYEMDSEPMPVHAPPAAAGLRLDVYPNPAREQAMIDVTLDAAGPLRIELRDLLGRCVWTTETGTLSAGTHAFALPVDRLSPGSYIVSTAAKAVLLRVLR